jgi:hypothetical protein
VDSTSVATGTDVTALMFVKQPNGTTYLPEIKTGLDLTATRRVLGDLTQPEVVRDGDIATWKEWVEIVDQDDQRVRATERELCLDRHTNEAREPCTNQYVQTKVDANNQPIREDGIAQPGVNLKFPFDTEQRSYQVYDLTLRAAAEAKFDGTEEINGLEVYRFVQDIPPAKIEAGRQVPGSLINEPETAAVEVDLYYQNKRTMWVEPTTGQIVKGQEEQLQELRKPDLPEGTAVFRGTLTFTEETVNQLVADAESNKSKLWLLTGLPTILWIAGTLLILAGIALTIFFMRGGRGGRGSRQPGPPPQRELADAAR